MKTPYQSIVTYPLNTHSLPQGETSGVWRQLIEILSIMTVNDRVTWRSDVARTALMGVGIDGAWVNLGQTNIYYRFEGMPLKSSNTSSCSLAVVEMSNLKEMFTLLYNMWWPSNFLETSHPIAIPEVTPLSLRLTFQISNSKDSNARDPCINTRYSSA